MESEKWKVESEANKQNHIYVSRGGVFGTKSIVSPVIDFQFSTFNFQLVLLITLLISLLFLTSCGSSSNGDSEAFVIAGSTSVQPYVEVLVEEYTARYPNNIIDVQGGGSSAGIQAVESHTAQIGMSSRNLRDNELYLWNERIAKDGLAIIINPDNPVTDLSLEQIRGIYTADINNWNQVGGNDARIHIITREEGSGTRSAFEELVMDNQRITPRAIVQDSNGAVRQLVAGDPNSIGFISLGLVDIGERPVKALRIEGIAATRNNVLNGDYALYRSFIFVALEKPEGNVLRFIEFIRSPEGQAIMAERGLIPEFGVHDD